MSATALMRRVRLTWDDEADFKLSRGRNAALEVVKAAKPSAVYWNNCILSRQTEDQRNILKMEDLNAAERRTSGSRGSVTIYPCILTVIHALARFVQCSISEPTAIPCR